jgi:hypothetical protein
MPPVSTLKMEVAGLCEALADKATRHHNPDSVLQRLRDFELVVRGERQQDPIKGSAVAAVVLW